MKSRLAKICPLLPFSLLLAFFAALIVLPYILENAKSVVIMKQMKKRIALAILSLHALASPAFSDEIRKISLPKDAVTIQHKVFDTDIFWEVIPWNDGSSLTVDGWGRYSVLSFDKKGRLRQKTLCDFPKKQLTGGFYADRNTGFVYTRNQNIFHIYNANSKIKRSAILALIYFSDVTCGLFPLDERRMLVIPQIQVYNL